MGLTKEEKATLAALTKKAEEPDTPTPNVNFSLDLSSDSAWERAKKLGLVKDDDDDDDDGGDDGEADDAPRRRGYFPAGGK